MTACASSLPSLWESLGEVPDFRGRQGRRYTLQSLLALGIVATLCGYQSYGAMAEWIKNYGFPIAEQLGFSWSRSPSIGTLHNAFSNLDKKALESVLNSWATHVLERYGETESSTLSIDGKFLRASHPEGVLAPMMVTAVCHKIGVVLAQRSVEPKEGEIMAVRRMIQELVLEGKTLTLDALHTNPKTAEMIVEKGGTIY